jgi:outer membrane protein assembly factor BamB
LIQMEKFRRYRTAMLLILAALFLAGCGVRSGVSWPDVAIYPGQNGEATIFVAYNSQIDRVDLTGSDVFLVDADGNRRKDTSGNDRKWQIRSGDVEGDAGFYVAPILIDEQTLIVPDYNNRLLIFEATDEYVRQRAGAVNEITLPGRIVTSPVVYSAGDGRRLLLVPLREHDLVAYAIDDGFSHVWTFQTERGIWAEPLIVDEVVYVAGMDHHLYALNANSGNELWRIDLGAAVAGTPFFDGTDIFVGTFGREFFRIGLGDNFGDPQSRILSTYKTTGWIWSHPAYSNGTFYLGDMNGNVYALTVDGDEFVEQWRHRVSEAGIRPAPVVTNSYVVIASRRGEVIWLSRATGEEIQRYELDTEILAEMVVIEAQEGSERPTLILVSTDKNDKILVPFTADGARYTWTYQR